MKKPASADFVQIERLNRDFMAGGDALKARAGTTRELL
jgi:hypothetical protein